MSYNTKMLLRNLRSPGATGMYIQPSILETLFMNPDPQVTSIVLSAIQMDLSVNTVQICKTFIVYSMEKDIPLFGILNCDIFQALEVKYKHTEKIKR